MSINTLHKEDDDVDDDDDDDNNNNELMWKNETFSVENNITCTTNCRYRMATKLYTLEAWFVSGI